MPRYSPGDRVIVRPDLEENVRYDMDDYSINLGAADGMLRFAGTEVTIRSVEDGTFYKIEEGSYGWTDGMFLGCTDEVDERSF